MQSAPKSKLVLASPLPPPTQARLRSRRWCPADHLDCPARRQTRRLPSEPLPFPWRLSSQCAMGAPAERRNPARVIGDLHHGDGPSIKGGKFHLATVAAFIDVNDRKDWEMASSASRPWRDCGRLAPGAAELLVPIMQSVQQFVAACAGTPREGVLEQPLERGVPVRLLLWRAGALFAGRLQQPFEARAH